MAATMYLCEFAGITYTSLSKEENLLLEAGLFAQICEELKETFKQSYNNYFRSLRYDAKLEHEFMETNLLRHILQDILNTDEYSLAGIAQYTHTPEEVLYDIAAGNNTNPSAFVLRRIIELHRTIRPELYRMIIRKVLCQTAANN